MIQEPVISSGEKSASAAILARAGILYAVDFTPPTSSGTATLKIYDNATTNSGTILCETLITNSSAVSLHLSFPNGVFASKGIYAAYSDGTSSSVYVVRYQSA